MVIHGRPPWPTALAALSGFAAAGVRDPPPALRCGAWEGVENQMHIWSRKNKRKEEKGRSSPGYNRWKQWWIAMTTKNQNETSFASLYVELGHLLSV